MAIFCVVADPPPLTSTGNRIQYAQKTRSAPTNSILAMLKVARSVPRGSCRVPSPPRRAYLDSTTSARLAYVLHAKEHRGVLSYIRQRQVIPARAFTAAPRARLLYS